ncbi:MAG: hypothetical protein AAFQ98_17595, partial [Bacteroidota bacterium]
MNRIRRKMPNMMQGTARTVTTLPLPKKIMEMPTVNPMEMMEIMLRLDMGMKNIMVRATTR